MGIYSNQSSMYDKRVSSEVVNDTWESLLENHDYDLDPNTSIVDEGLNACLAIQENYNIIMQNIGLNELNYLEKTGEEFVYTEGVLRSMYDTVKKFILKIWEKIKTLFKKFTMTLDSYMKNDKEFVNKYRQQIMRNSSNLTDFTFKGYKWTIDEDKWKPAMVKCAVDSGAFLTTSRTDSNMDDERDFKTTVTVDDDVIKKVEKDNEDFDDKFENIRGQILETIDTRYKGAHTLEEFRKDLREIFRNGEENKEELDSKDIDVMDMMQVLQNRSQTDKTIKKAYDENRKIIDQDIKFLDKEFTAFSKKMPSGGKTDDRIDYSKKDNFDSTFKAKYFASGINDNDFNAIAKDADGNYDVEKMKAYMKKHGDWQSKKFSYYTKLSNALKSCLLTIDSELLNAVKERSRQYKSCLVAIVYYNRKNESFEESFYNTSYSTPSSFLSNIELK